MRSSLRRLLALTVALAVSTIAPTIAEIRMTTVEGVAEPLVLWAIADALRTLLRLSEMRAAGRPLAQAMREARVPRPRERIYERALQRVDAGRLQAALQRAARTDRMIKGIDPSDAWLGIEVLVMSIAGAPTLAETAETTS